MYGWYSPGPLGRGLQALGVATYGTDASGASRLHNGSAWPIARRSRAVTWYSQPRERSPARKAGLEHDNGAPTPRALPHLSRLARSASSSAQQNSCVSLPATVHGCYPTTRRHLPAPPNSLAASANAHFVASTSKCRLSQSVGCLLPDVLLQACHSPKTMFHTVQQTVYRHRSDTPHGACLI